MRPDEWFDIEDPREGWLALPPVVREVSLRAWGESQQGKVKVARNRGILQAWAEGADCADIARSLGVSRAAVVYQRDRAVRRARLVMKRLADQQGS